MGLAIDWDREGDKSLVCHSPAVHKSLSAAKAKADAGERTLLSVIVGPCMVNKRAPQPRNAHNDPLIV